jgi:peptide chain release factor 1
VRIPPTEKNDRIQTSFITVAIMTSEEESEFKLNLNDISITYTRSSGPGGQNVNKVSSCVQMTHIPTGIQIKVQDTRDQNKNKEIAYQRMTDKLKSIEDQKNYEKSKNFRNDQIGEGGRGLKRRTYRIREDSVIDHITGKTCRWKDILKGKIELLS